MHAGVSCLVDHRTPAEREREERQERNELARYRRALKAKKQNKWVVMETYNYGEGNLLITIVDTEKEAKDTLAYFVKHFPDRGFYICSQGEEGRHAS